MERLCTECIENGGVIQPIFYIDKEGRLCSHSHCKENKQ